MTSRARRFVEVAATRLWPTVVAFSLLAAVSVAANQPGRYVGDNRFDQFWNPGRRLARQFLAWDPQRGLGREREDFWPGVTWPLAWLRGVGVDPVASQRLWHAAILAAAGVGMVAVLRLLRPRIGPEHLLAGLVVMFSAYSATFLVPSNLAVNFALAPWMIVIFVRGVVGGEPWRWAGAFALVVFAAGTTDPPGLVLAASPLIAVAVYLVLVERTVRWRHVLAWVARAGSLSVATSAFALTKIWTGSGPFSQRLGGTELPEVSSATSSWSESLRGLGHWRSYFIDVLGPSLPQGLPYFNNRLVVLATFSLPVVAVLTLGLSRWRPRLLFGLMMLLSLVLMVAAFPLDDPSPLGRGILAALTEVEVLGSLRNTYKAGAGLVLGSAALFGLGVVGALRWLAQRRRSWAVLGGIAVAGVVALVAFPFWSGRLYDPRTTLESVPAYWDEAFAYLDEIEGSTGGVALVLPGAGRAPYRWGWPGDDLYEARTDRPVVERIGVPLSAPLAANLVDALALAANDPAHQPGTLGPALRRLGITHVLVRNDLAWGGRVGPRPTAFAGLRSDPDLVLAAAFGSPGENTTSPLDESSLAAGERALPPVEIYEVVGAQGGVRAPATLPPLVVSGDGSAWVPLAAAGQLEGDRPVLYSGTATEEQLVDVLEAGGGVVVTDTNRRQLRVQIAYDADRSYLLAEGQSLDRPVPSLFDQPGSESVAWFPDARQVASDGPPRSPLGTQGWIRPSNATDGDPATEWISSAFDGPLRRTLTVTLRQPTEVDRISVIEARTADEPFLTGAEVSFSDGSTVLVPMAGGRGELQFAPRVTQSIAVRAAPLPEVDGVPLQPLGLGFAEIAIGQLDLREFVQVPDDLLRRAETDTDLAEALADAPFAYLFTRETGSDYLDPTANPLASDPVRNRLEAAMRRRFRTPQVASWSMQATLRAEAIGGLGAPDPVEVGVATGNGSDTDCRDVGLRLDDDPVAVRVLGEASPGTDGAARVRVAACEPVELGAGWHLLDAGPATGVDVVDLRTGPPPTARPATTVDLAAEGVDPAGFGVQLVAPEGAVVGIGQGWDPRWRASLDGVDLGPPLALDTLSAWVLPPTSGGDLRVSFGPERWLRLGLAVTALTLALCLWLVLRRAPTMLAAAWPTIGTPGPDATHPRAAVATTLTAIAASALSLLVIGWWALPAIGIAVPLLRWRRDAAIAVLGALAATGLGLAAVVTAANGRGDEASVLSPGAPDSVLAATGGRVAGAFIVLLLVVAVVGERAGTRSGRAGATVVVGSWRRVAARTRAAVVAWLPIGLLAVGAALGVVWRGAAALPEGLAVAVGELARGFDPASSVAAGLGIDDPVAIPPLAPVVVAFAPVPATWALACLAAVAVVVASRVGARLAATTVVVSRRRVWSTLAAGMVALLLVLVLPSLPWLLTAVALAGAGLLVDPARLDGRRAVGAGLCAGAAVLAVPASVAAIVALLLWPVLGGRARLAAAVIAVGAGVVAPWVVWVGSLGGGAGLTTSWVWTAGAGAPALVLVITVAVAVAVVTFLWWRRSPPERVEPPK